MQTSPPMGLTIARANKFPFCLRCFEFVSLATIAYTIRCLQKVHILWGHRPVQFNEGIIEEEFELECTFLLIKIAIALQCIGFLHQSVK